MVPIVMPGKAGVLVVDDTPMKLVLINHLLKHDYRGMLASSGAQGLQMAGADQPPDLILLDIMMPGMDGHEACRGLKANPKTRDIPVIFLTAMAEVEDQMKGFSLGAVDYITKPIRAPILLARVRNHIALKAAAEMAKNYFYARLANA